MVHHICSKQDWGFTKHSSISEHIITAHDIASWHERGEAVDTFDGPASCGAEIQKHARRGVAVVVVDRLMLELRRCPVTLTSQAISKNQLYHL